jgi:hypothetical protein
MRKFAISANGRLSMNFAKELSIDAVAPRAKHAFHEQGLELLGWPAARTSPSGVRQCKLRATNAYLPREM